MIEKHEADPRLVRQVEEMRASLVTAYGGATFLQPRWHDVRHASVEVRTPSNGTYIITFALK